MHRLLLLFAFMLPLAASTHAADLVFEVDLTDRVVAMDPEDGSLKMEGRATTVLREDGRPQLPMLPLNYALPQGTRAKSVRVVATGWDRLDQFPTPAFAAGATSSEGDIVPQHGLRGLPAWEAAAAQNQEIWPPLPGVLGNALQWHGQDIASVLLLPIRERNGQLEQMRGARIEIELESLDFDRLPTRRKVDWPGMRDQDLAQIRGLVSNPQDVDTYAPIRGRDPQEIAIARRTPALPSSRADYLIITTQALAAAFQPLADAHTREGLASSIVTIEDIETNFRLGGDQQETIRNYIKHAYEQRGVRYLLIGGDAEVLAPRYARSKFYPPGSFTDIPTDLYYAGIDGNWNDDQDGIFGEGYVDFVNNGDDVDFLAEIAVGRAPVETAADVTVFVNKCLDYMDPNTNSDTYGRSLFLSEVLFPQQWDGVSTPTLDGASYSENLLGSYIVGGGNFMQAWRMYENYTNYFGAIEETKSAAMDSIQSGNFGLIHHIGHGFYYNMSVGDDNITVSDADLLSNGPDWFVLYALNCSSGAFDFDCLLERFIQNPNGGSVMSLGSARAAFPTTSDNYQQQFYDQVFVDHNTRVGDAMLEGRAVYAGNTLVDGSDRWTHFTYVLLGDPALHVWTETPQQAALSVPASVALGAASVTASVTRGGNAVEGALVAISDASGTVVSDSTDVAGSVVLDLTPFSGSAQALNVVASGKNMLPDEASVSVGAVGSVHIRANALSIDDSANAPSAGDGDGDAESGETVQWLFNYTNDGGGGVATGITATLSAIDPSGVLISSDTVVVGTLGDGATAGALSEFVLDLTGGVEDGSTPRFRLDVNSDQGSWAQVFELPLHSAELEIVRTWWDDSAGNGNGEIDAGEQVDLYVELKNFGSGDASGLSGSLSTSDVDITLSQNASTWADLNLKEASANLVAFELSEADVGTENWMQLDVTDSRGRVWSWSLELRRPAAPLEFALDTALGPNTIAVRVADELPTSAHFHGYRFYRANQASGPFALVSEDTIERSGFFRDAGLASLTRYWYEVAAIDSSGVESIPTASVSASTAPPEFAGGFPLPVGREVAGEVGVGDLRGDGSLVAAFGSDFIYAIDSAGQELLDGDNDSQTLGPLGGPPAPDDRFTPSGVAVADLDGDGQDEVIASNWNTSEIWVLQADGTSLPGWPRSMNNKSWASPVVADLDNDGDFEIAVNNVGARTYVWHHDGSDFFDGDANAGTVGVFQIRSGENFNRSTPAAIDVDGDGTLELVFGTHQRGGLDNFVHALRNDGTDAPGWPKNLGTAGYNVGSISAADLDLDGDFELVFPCDNDSLYVWNGDGTNHPGFPIYFKSEGANKDSKTPSPAFGDFDKDGNLEMVVVSIISHSLCELHILDQTGTNLPGYPISLPGLSESSPVVGDLDGDNSLDVVFGIGGGSDNLPSVLYAFDVNGTDIGGFPITLGGAVRGTPAIVDFDQDGDTDVLFVGFDRLFHVWDMPGIYRSWMAPWPTFHGDMRRTGVFNQERATSAPSLAIDLVVWSGGIRILGLVDGALPRDARFLLERSEDDGQSWNLIADNLLAEGSELSWDDRDAKPGQEVRYRLSGPGVSVESRIIRVPQREVVLGGNYPNPFNPSTTIFFELPSTAGPQLPVRLEILDIQGRRIRLLSDGPLAAGPHSIQWDGRDDAGSGVASGNYVVRLHAAGSSRTQKITLLK